MTPETIIQGGAGLFVISALAAIGMAFWRFLGWFIRPARGR